MLTKCQFRSSIFYRPWANIALWSNDLHGLPKLEQLEIHTEHDLIRPLGSLYAEEALIFKWLTGKHAVKANWGRSGVHPSLYNIFLHYGAEEAVSSEWWKASPRWTRTLHTRVAIDDEV